MAIRNIVKDGDPILRKKSREVVNFDRRLHTLIDDMIATLEEANGLGIAAPQVGVLRRVVIVMDAEMKPIELVNPEILSTEGENEGPEGCLSFPGMYGVVARPTRVEVRAKNRYGKPFTASGDGIVARAFCHEIDHLNGDLFVDKVIRYITEEDSEEMREAEETGEQG
ncbi:MAG: peptide deformylase [Oscillospiraceae bacterium]|nr:peptide deformylase [Oscillospiraceae bacterium]